MDSNPKKKTVHSAIAVQLSYISKMLLSGRVINAISDNLLGSREVNTEWISERNEESEAGFNFCSTWSSNLWCLKFANVRASSGAKVETRIQIRFPRFARKIQSAWAITKRIFRAKRGKPSLFQLLLANLGHQTSSAAIVETSYAFLASLRRSIQFSLL